MKTNHYKQQSIKLLGFITLACFSLFLSSCGTENDENFEMPSEEVLERVSAATEVAGKYFSECSSISELEKHLDEIRNTEGVVDVWTDDQTMYVEYEGWGIMPYYYPDYSDDKDLIVTRSIDKLTINNAKTSKTRSTSTRAADNVRIEKTHYRLNDLEKHSMVIYDVFSNDEQTLHLFGNEQDLVADFIKMGYEVNYVNKQNPCNDFFRRAIYDYDLIYLKTHGSYTKRIDPTTNEEMKKHWLMTGIYYESGPRTNLGFTPQQIVDLKKKGLGISTPFTEVFSYKEKVNGQIQNSLYWLVSEDGLAALSGHFVKPSIIFSSACRSLEESNTIGDIFCNKGAACYLGYDKESRIKISSKAAYYFFEGLLNGMTVQSSYDKLDSIYQCDNEFSKAVEVEPGNGGFIKGDDGLFYPATDGTGNYNLTATNARLTIVTKDNNEDNKHVCITHPKTISYEEKGNKVTLKGSIKIADPNNDNEYGFALHTSGSNTASPIKPSLNYGKNKDNFEYNKEDHILSFWCTVNINQFKDVDKFCAYLYDGERYCLGELVDILVENLTGNVQGFVDYSSLIGLKSDKVIELLGEPKQQYAKYDYGYSVIPESEKLNDLLTYGLFVNMDDGRVGSVRQKVRCPKYNVISYFDKKYHLLDEGETIAYYADKSTLEESTILIYVKADDLDNEEVTEVKYEGLLDMYSVYDRETKTLTFKYGNFYYDVAHGYDINDITLDLSEGNIYARKVVFDPSFAQARPQDTYNWFYCAFSLTEIIGLEYLNTSEVVSMRRMFYDCDKLTTLDLSGFDTRNVERMSGMFSGCSSLTTLDLSSFDTGNVEDMSEMFLLCTSLTTLDLSSFDTSNVKNMYDMFYGCKNLKTIYATDKWTIDKVENKKRQFTFGGCEQLVGGMGTQWKSYGIEYARIDGGPEAPGYFTAK